MNKPVEVKSKFLVNAKILKSKQNEIEESTTKLKVYAIKETKLIQARRYYAAAKIQGLVRGFLSRLEFYELKRTYRAVVHIQRFIRGKLGRIRWQREYWKSLSVVKSNTALQVLLERSTIVRHDEKTAWQEMFDPLTYGFWYYNTRNHSNIWTCPVVFQHNLVCKWEGFQEFGGSSGGGRCRCVFKTLIEYHGHIQTAHKWFCPACDSKNSGVVFPRCSLCENTFAESGINTEKVFEDHINRVTKDIKKFISHHSGASNVKFHIKNKLIECEVKLLSEREQIRKHKEEEELAKDQKRKSKFISKVHSQDGEHELSLMDERAARLKFRNKHAVANATTSASVASSVVSTVQLPAIGGGKSVLLSSTSTNTTNANTANSTSGTVSSSSGHVAKKIPPPKTLSHVPPPPQHASSKNLHLTLSHTTNLSIFDDHSSGWNEDPLQRGEIPAIDFDLIVKNKSLSEEEKIEMLEDEESVVSTYSYPGIMNAERMQVCRKYLHERCSASTCPLAHPGVRDEAEIEWIRIPGTKRKVAFVKVCPLGISGNCPQGKACTCYHPYVRPSTQEIIARIYPKEAGTKKTEYKSGAIQDGNVLRDKYNGYGIFTWVSGSTYIGDWKEGERSGFGMFRSHDGTEYVGEWLGGKKHGWGILTWSNGEEYIGSWAEGKRHGTGRMSSLNGDVFEGEFFENKYSGIGHFRQGNGDQYMGHFKNHMADGVGVVSLSTGEKYKGYFQCNARHGKGICRYANGSTYAGQWYRGYPDGRGIYVCPPDADGIQERYVGEFSNGEKHGKGRYLFKNGDFYDGEFNHNLARGIGLYYHTAEGNLYTGEWDNDMRQGRGTYVFANGSKYTGGWFKNNIHGKGKFDFANGSFYRGQLDNNIKHGKGIFIWPNGNTYKGNFVNGLMDGTGEMTYATGHKYVGNWKNNKKNGYGVFTYFEGHVYAGDWVNDVRQGRGKLSFFPNTPLEEFYHGDWDGDEKHGDGLYSYRQSEHTLYEGQWNRGQRHGKGKLTFRDGSFYRGDFQFELMHGKGVYVGADGSQYEGEWCENERHGEGSLMDANGAIYKGMFYKNRRHGAGTVEFVNGSRYSGHWDSGGVEGKGVCTILCGEGAFGGPTSVRVKVFGV